MGQRIIPTIPQYRAGIPGYTAPQQHFEAPKGMHGFPALQAFASPAYSPPQGPQQRSQHRPAPPPDIRAPNNRNGDSNGAHHINQRFKGTDAKYFGSADEVLQDFIDTYMAMRKIASYIC